MNPSKRKILGVIVAGTAVLGVATGAYAWVTNSGGGSASVTLAAHAPGVAATGAYSCSTVVGGSGFCADVFPGKADGNTVVTVTNTQDRPIQVSEFLPGSSTVVAAVAADATGPGSPAVLGCPADSIQTLDRIAAPLGTALTQVTIDSSNQYADNGLTVIAAGGTADYVLSTHFHNLPRFTTATPAVQIDTNNQDGCLGQPSSIALNINWDYVTN